MQGAIVLYEDDVRRIIAEHFDMPIECVRAASEPIKYLVIGKIEEDNAQGGKSE